MSEALALHPRRAVGDGARAGGDADSAAIGAVLADRGRCQVLLALADGRALRRGGSPPRRVSARPRRAATPRGWWTQGCSPSSRTAATATPGLAGPQLGQLIEVLTRLAPALPIRSLRQGTRAHALRQARVCYDHLAGRLGVAVMRGMLDRRLLAGGDGTFHPDRTGHDRRAGYGRDVDDRLTRDGHAFLADLGIAVPPRPVIRYCVDWSEQRHHLAGAVGRLLLARMTELGWLRRSDTTRAVHLTQTRRAGLRDLLSVEVPDGAGPA